MPISKRIRLTIWFLIQLPLLIVLSLAGLFLFILVWIWCGFLLIPILDFLIGIPTIFIFWTLERIARKVREWKGYPTPRAWGAFWRIGLVLSFLRGNLRGIRLASEYRFRDKYPTFYYGLRRYLLPRKIKLRLFDQL